MNNPHRGLPFPRRCDPSPYIGPSCFGVESDTDVVLRPPSVLPIFDTARVGRFLDPILDKPTELQVPASCEPKLAQVISLKKLGVDDIVHFDFMEPPGDLEMVRKPEKDGRMCVDNMCVVFGVPEEDSQQVRSDVPTPVRHA